MDLGHLYEILDEVAIEVINKDKFDEVNKNKEFHFVDCQLEKICVDYRLAQYHRPFFRDFLNDRDVEQVVKEGASYKSIEKLLDSGEEKAFRFLAVGESLGFWQVITPVAMAVTGRAADQLARLGEVRIGGYKKAA